MADTAHDTTVLLAKMIEDLGREVRGDIKEVKELAQDTYAEARKTNGRVTKLERRMDMVAARNEGRNEVVAEQQTRHVRRMDQWHWRIGTLIAFTATVAAVSVAMAHLWH